MPSAAIFLFRAISSSTSASSVSKPGLLYSILMPSVFALLLLMPPLFRPKMLCTLLALGGISTLAATIPPANATHNTPETAVLMILTIILLSFFFCAITVSSFSFGYTTRFIAVLRSASTPLLDVILSYKLQNEPFSAQSVILEAYFAEVSIWFQFLLCLSLILRAVSLCRITKCLCHRCAMTETFLTMGQAAGSAG